MKYIFLDVECFTNYFLICLKSSTGDTFHYELHSTSTPDRYQALQVLKTYKSIGFNSKKYDLPMIYGFLSGYDNLELKKLSDELILGNNGHWKVLQQRNLEHFKSVFDHIDIFEPAKASLIDKTDFDLGLKMYGARMHTKTLQDLPLDPDAIILPEQYELLRKYCYNDVEITIELYERLKDVIDLRVRLGERYDTDLRSMSDPQIAEAIIKKRLGLTKVDNGFNPLNKYTYTPPSYINLKTSDCIDLLIDIANTTFKLSEFGKIIKPDNLTNRKINIGGVNYTFGIGGLHSIEKNIGYQEDSDYFLIDADVSSYYPSVIINNEFAPKQLGKPFIAEFKLIKIERMEFKNSSILEVKKDAECLKIVLNGAFGKYGSPYSIFYSPENLLATTLTGQLSVLMLIEMVSEKGIEIVSANTDGITIKCKHSNKEVLGNIFNEWQTITSLDLEFTNYKSIHYISVGNYLAITKEGKVKSKGFSILDVLHLKPKYAVCLQAVIEYLKNKTDIEEYIRSVKDLRAFIVCSKVKGGAVWKGEKIGKVVRWYYGLQGENVYYCQSSNKVQLSEKAEVVMTLPDEFPKDIDYNKYVEITRGLLNDLTIERHQGILF